MQKETFLQYLTRKIKRQKGDYKTTILFSQRVLNLNPWRKYQTLKQFLAQLSSIPLIQNAICDPKGLSGFNLKLHNAHIQKHHCDIFYNLYYKASKGVFGGGGYDKHTLTQFSRF